MVKKSSQTPGQECSNRMERRAVPSTTHIMEKGGIGEQAGAQDSLDELTDPVTQTLLDMNGVGDGGEGKSSRRRERRQCSDHLTGLIGWWRRVEL